MSTVYFSGSREELRRIIALVPAMASGRVPDANGIAQAIQARGGVALLSKIQQAFLVKSRGGTDECGIKWPPLKRETIAQRRTTAAERKQLDIGGRRLRGLLTPDQDRQWRGIYAGRLRKGDTPAEAATLAWGVLKKQGAKTKLEVLGGRQVDILRDTGLMFKSLSPGVADRPSGAQFQVFEMKPGEITVGTNRYPWHHLGIPGRLPARNLWPTDGRLPDSWWKAIAGAMSRGVVQAMIYMISSATPPRV